MFKNEYILSVDLKKKSTKTIPIFVQYDNAALVFKIYDNGEAFDLTELTEATVVHKLPDGSIFSDQGQLDSLNGQQIIRYAYAGDEMRIIGTVSITLSLFSGASKVSIPSFNLEIIDKH